MEKILVICGDSFNWGIGCKDQSTQPYGVLIAKKLGWNLVRLARGSSSNYIIHLQANYAAKMKPKPDLVIIGQTSYDRVEWIAEGKTVDSRSSRKLEEVNYHQYPPHYHAQPFHDNPFDFYLKDNPAYDPKILCEHVVAFPDYFSLLDRLPAKERFSGSDYYKRLHSEPIEKLKLIEKYYFDIWDPTIKRDYDIAVLLKAYRTVKKAGIKCLLFGPDTGIGEFVDEPKDYYHQDWYGISQRFGFGPFPDSGHTGEAGHAYTAECLFEYLGKHNFI